MAETEIPSMAAFDDAPDGSSEDASYELNITQSWRGRDYQGGLMPLHWAITVKTASIDGKPVGNVYNAAGNIDSFMYDAPVNVLLQDANWRGNLKICSIPQTYLPELTRLFSEVPVERYNPDWNCQNWVWGAVHALRESGHEALKGFSMRDLRSKMLELLDSWEAGDI
ncbi:predicted protein [Postia placenta Mad-698-R]|uniref:PPPDE domain-containing protein n=2 Tax=Rhodonia placenta TaxID=104341 RepID=A0A1X6NG89_9APHY|nr:hypothetical protein POSPLADRAFT_1068578 [Postia placenta MAD-698-R-SB12]EED78422.1 predicted protein [Postia placenta Mad-698-R]KAF9821943.1 hypothetical protein IEO21_00373 [Postia placenta]OSX67657.1 hypothetical protein POSPLADRAFT_1068578 [Postia placenta MAD-698-R-SB12]